MTKFVIYSYNGAGASIRYLSSYLDNAVIATRHTIPDLHNKILINYGASYLTLSWKSSWFNSPTDIAKAINKIKAFRFFEQHDVACPPWTLNSSIVKNWLEQGKTVYVRETASGSEGHGIRLLNHPMNTIPYGEFYAQAINHDDEYRVHVVRGKVISVGKKYKKEPNANPYIRNMDNGWAFHLHVSAPESVKKLGKRAVNALNMDFGAADIGHIRATDAAFVFEVNSAPTMSSPTASAYAEAFSDSVGH